LGSLRGPRQFPQGPNLTRPTNPPEVDPGGASWPSRSLQKLPQSLQELPQSLWSLLEPFPVYFLVKSNRESIGIGLGASWSHLL